MTIMTITPYVILASMGIMISCSESSYIKPKKIARSPTITADETVNNSKSSDISSEDINKIIPDFENGVFTPKTGNLQLALGDLLQEPSIYTWGVAELSFTWEGEATYEISLRRLSTYSGDSEDALGLCSGIVLSANGEESDEFSITKSTSVQLLWRSVYGKQMIDQIAEDTILSNKPSPECGLQIKFSSRDDSGEMMLWLTIIPGEGNDYEGSISIEEAIKKRVVLITKSSSAAVRAAREKATVVEYDPEIHNPPGKVAAIFPEDIELETAQQNPESFCYQDETNPSQIADPDFEITTDIKIISPGTLREVASDPRSNSEKCSEYIITEDPITRSLTATMSCGGYFSLRDNAQDCYTQISLENPEDPLNSISKTIGIPELPVKLTNLGTMAGGAVVIPQDEDNPIRLGEVKLSLNGPSDDARNNQNLTAVSEQQEYVLTRGFDLWSYFSAESHEEVSRNHLKRINLTDRDSCSNTNVLGFAFLSGGTVNHCLDARGGWMRSAKIADGSFESFLISHMVTIFHEVMHTRGFPHDFDNSRIEPCKGPSYSAQIAVDILNCDKPLCAPFKSVARSEYIMEMRYSYNLGNNNDPRIQQGLCKEWSDLTGIEL